MKVLKITWHMYIPNVNKDSKVIMCKLKSRFVSNKPKYCWAFKIVLRTVGCCSHVMTILYYLEFAQRNSGVPQKSAHSNNVFAEFENFGSESELSENEEV